MKKIIYSLLVAAGLASCSDSLEQTPIGVLAQGNLPASDEDAIALVNAAYQVNVIKSTAFGYMTDLVTETTISGENPNGGGGLLGLLKWDGNNSYITGMWRDLNHGIAAANDAMTPMADINVIEEDIPYVSAHKSELVDKYTEIFTDLQSK